MSKVKAMSNWDLIKVQSDRLMDIKEPDVLTQDFINSLGHKYLLNKFEVEVKAKGNRGIIKGFGSTYDVDEERDKVIPGAFTENLDKFSKNPVMLFSHQLNQILGSWTEFEEQEKGLYLEGEINLKTDVGKYVYTLIGDNDLKGLSIGYSILKRAYDEENEILELIKLRLWEVSVVAIPMNQNAWITATKIFSGADVKDEEVKTVISYKNYGYADEDEAWQAGREVREAEVSDLKKMCAWYDSKEPDVKSSYKLPHHRASDKKGIWRGIAAAMGALLGARGGVNIPDSDKKGVYNHLAKHYKDLDKDVPALKVMEDMSVGVDFEVPFDFKDVEWHEDEKFILECASLDGSLQSSINILKYFIKEDRIKSINRERLAEMLNLLADIRSNDYELAEKTNLLEELNPQEVVTNTTESINHEKDLDEVLAICKSLKGRITDVRKFNVSDTVRDEIRKALAEATGKDLR